MHLRIVDDLMFLCCIRRIADVARRRPCRQCGMIEVPVICRVRRIVYLVNILVFQDANLQNTTLDNAVDGAAAIPRSRHVKRRRTQREVRIRSPPIHQSVGDALRIGIRIFRHIVVRPRIVDVKEVLEVDLRPRVIHQRVAGYIQYIGMLQIPLGIDDVLCRIILLLCAGKGNPFLQVIRRDRALCDLARGTTDGKRIVRRFPSECSPQRRVDTVKTDVFIFSDVRVGRPLVILDIVADSRQSDQIRPVHQRICISLQHSCVVFIDVRMDDLIPRRPVILPCKRLW